MSKCTQLTESPFAFENDYDLIYDFRDAAFHIQQIRLSLSTKQKLENFFGNNNRT